MCRRMLKVFMESAVRVEATEQSESLSIAVLTSSPSRLLAEASAELVIVCGGKGVLESEGKSLPLVRGDVIFMPRGADRVVRSTSDFRALSITFDENAFLIPERELLRVPGFAAFFVYEPKARVRLGLDVQLRLRAESCTRVQVGFLRLKDELEIPNKSSDVLCKSMFTSAVLDLADRYANSGEPRAVALVRLSPALCWLDDHFDEPVTMEALGELCGISQRVLQRCFHRAFGITPVTYLLDLRIGAAQSLLRTTETSIKAIAAAVGITDASYFSRRFRLKTGLEPKVYRDQHRARGGNSSAAFV